MYSNAQCHKDGYVYPLIPQGVQQQLAAQAAQQESQARLLSTVSSMVRSLAQTVNDLSSLPGAADIIGPHMASVVEGILIHTTSTPPQSTATAPAQLSAQAFAYPALSLPKRLSSSARLSSLDSFGRQMPGTPPQAADSLALPPQHTTPAQMAPAGFAALMQQHMSGLHASQVAAEAPVIPNPRRFLPRQLSDTTTDYSSCDDADHEAQPPSTKRQRSDSITADLLVAQAQHALAAVMAQKQQQAVFPSGAHTNQPSAAAAAANNLLGPSCAVGGVGLPPVPLSGHRAASLNDMMEAAEILTAFTAPSMYSVDTQSPVGQEAYCHTDPWSNSMAPDDQEWTGADEQWAVPEFTVGASRPAARGKPAPKPRKKAAAAGGGARQPGKARKVADKRNTTHFQDEANHCCPETVATLKAAWAATESIPVTCVNTSTGTRAEGTFKIMDGKKRIVFSGPTPYAAEGTIMEPVEFEKAGDRGSTRNWQLSITVAGMYLKKGCRTELKLGHATRILGIHMYPTN